jgi:ribosomal protein S18 acetylase RimI-like enzyme
VGTDVDPFANWPDRTRLYDGSGGLLLVYSESQDARDGRPWADGAWRPASAPVDATSAAVADRLRGYAFSTSDEELARSLEAAGAVQLRHAHTLSHPLEHLVTTAADDPELAIEPLTPAQLSRHAQRLGELHHAAYPIGHVDHTDDDVSAAVEHIRAIGRGELLGPLVPVSRVAIQAGQIVGACLVVDRDGTPPDGGPWVIDIFRDPTSPVGGVGAALLGGALAAARSAGLSGVSLAVSHQNPRALRLYSALGFVDTGQSWTLSLPTLAV